MNSSFIVFSFNTVGINFMREGSFITFSFYNVASNPKGPSLMLIFSFKKLHTIHLDASPREEVSFIIVSFIIVGISSKRIGNVHG